MLPNWSKKLLIRLSNSLDLPTYQLTYLHTYPPTICKHTYLPTSYSPPTILHPYLLTYLIIYLLLPTYHLKTYLPTSYFAPTILHFYLRNLITYFLFLTYHLKTYLPSIYHHKTLSTYFLVPTHHPTSLATYLLNYLPPVSYLSFKNLTYLPPISNLPYKTLPTSYFPPITIQIYLFTSYFPLTILHPYLCTSHFPLAIQNPYIPIRHKFNPPLTTHFGLFFLALYRISTRCHSWVGKLSIFLNTILTLPTLFDSYNNPFHYPLH